MTTTTHPPIGSHVPLADPLGGATERGADVIQVHLSAPQQWRAPKQHPHTAELAASPTPIYVHAPYLINPASIRAEIRQRSANALRTQLDAAATISAAGLVVHAGHPTGTGNIDDAVTGWLDVLDTVGDHPVPLLVENTAGGRAGPGRTLAGLDALFSAFDKHGHTIGFCLDTCHAHAAGLNMDNLVTQVLDVVPAIDLVHLNDSKDVAGSGRDRHENLGAGHINPEHLAETVAHADAPCVVETPGGPEKQAADIAWIREQLTTRRDQAA